MGFVLNFHRILMLVCSQRNGSMTTFLHRLNLNFLRPLHKNWNLIFFYQFRAFFPPRKSFLGWISNLWLICAFPLSVEAQGSVWTAQIEFCRMSSHSNPPVWLCYSDWILLPISRSSACLRLSVFSDSLSYRFCLQVKTVLAKYLISSTRIAN